MWGGPHNSRGDPCSGQDGLSTGWSSHRMHLEIPRGLSHSSHNGGSSLPQGIGALAVNLLPLHPVVSGSSQNLSTVHTTVRLNYRYPGLQGILRTWPCLLKALRHNCHSVFLLTTPCINTAGSHISPPLSFPLALPYYYELFLRQDVVCSRPVSGLVYIPRTP